MSNRHFTWSFIITLLLLSLMVQEKALCQASDKSATYVQIIETLSAQELQQLNFGRFSPESGGGEIVISPDGSRTATGTVVLASGPFYPGLFYVTGAPVADFSVHLPDEPAVLFHQGTPNVMLVNNWVSFPQASAGINTNPDGTQTISIGATLQVGALTENPAGLYSGTFEVTFAYN